MNTSSPGRRPLIAAFRRSRFLLLLALSVLGVGLAFARADEAAPRFGAIRWDAWCGDESPVGQAVEAALGPEKWHYRLPFFAEIVAKDRVRIDGTAQEIVDREIDFAARAGLSYWAFDYYSESSRMSLILARYLSSPQRGRIGFCMISGCDTWINQVESRRLASLLAEPGYLKVGGNRPVVYLGFLSAETLTRYGKTPETFRTVVDAFRKQVQAEGLGDPYLVIMDFDPNKGKKWADTLGAQAITSYDASGPAKGAPYRDLARYAEEFWERCRQTGAAVVPIVMAGHDRRPRVERPVFWETFQKPGVGIEKYYEAPKPDELAAHAARAKQWLREHREAAPEQLALIYSWNENDEGGWLVPTLSEGTARIDALAPVLAAPAR